MPAEVMPGVYLIQHEMVPGTSVAITIIVDESVAVVDSGLTTTPALHILPALAHLGIPPDRVRYIINTHGHGDHVEGNAHLVAATGATVLAHEADRDLIEQPTPVSTDEFGDIVASDRTAFASLPKPTTPPPPVGRALRDGDVIDIGTRQFRVLHTPGHSAGAMLLIDDAAGLIITGDSLQGRGTTGGLGTYVPLIFDVARYRQTLTRARDLAPNCVITSHAFRPSTTVRLDEHGWRELLLESAAAVDEVASGVITALQRAGGRATVPAVAQYLCTQFGYDGLTTCSLFTAQAMLDDLRLQGYVRSVNTSEQREWELR